jgi:cytochrome c peroxidase
VTRVQLVVATSLVTLALVLAFTVDSKTQARLSALPTEVAAPRDNPTTPEKVALGRLLFWDPILSGQQDVACATCHHPDFGYAENLDLSIGAHGVGLGAARAFAPGSPTRLVKRNSQTVLNTAFNGLSATGHSSPSEAPMFWDLRVRGLEAQALEPIKALEEMRGDAYPEDRALSVVIARLAAVPEYRRRFEQAFGARNAVSEVNLGRALAAFERTLVTTNAPFDRYMRGDSAAWNGSRQSAARTATTARCSRTSRATYSAFRTTGASPRRTPA